MCDNKDPFVDFENDQSLIHVGDRDHFSAEGILNVCLTSNTGECYV